MTLSFRRPAGVLVSALLAALASTAAGLSPVAAEPGADLAADISGKRVVRLGHDIIYTVTATNVGDATATDVFVDPWVPDWFDFVAVSCPGGTPLDSACSFPDLAPGASVSMTITLRACCPEPRMYELASVSASNDVNPANDEDRIKVTFTGPRR